LFSHVNHGRRSSSSSSRGAPVDCQLLPTERKFSVRVVVPYNFFSFLAGTPKFVCFFFLLLLRGVNFFTRLSLPLILLHGSKKKSS
jgi:hypothetical protein